MILFPNAKINLGLYITGKRPDGYHDISTVMVPVGWKDILEITPTKESETTIKVFGRKVDCPPEKNLVIKAYNSLSAFTGGLPPVTFHLEKIIPDGAGLGGGSADASFALKGLNELFNIGLTDTELAKVAVSVGADCPFFIYNTPSLCEGIGEKIAQCSVNGLLDKSILIVKPRVASVSTHEAYEGVKVGDANCNLSHILGVNPEEWRSLGLKNVFEDSVFNKLPQLREVKKRLYEYGALYASMTGSGAAVFGIFDNDNMAEEAARYFIDCDKIVTKALFLND